MSGSLSLNGTWGLTYAEGGPLMTPQHYTATHLRGRRLHRAPVPGSIHAFLQKEGLIDDPNLGINSLKARWVEEQFWIYRHAFDVPDEATNRHAWLVFDKIECDAIMWLNGEEVGRHCNANRPVAFDVTGRLKRGENLLIVQVTTGMHGKADAPVGDYIRNPMDMLTKRPLLRKPQYQTGWDWNARMTNVGILGDVRLEWSSGPRLDQVAVFATVPEDLTSATIHARVFVDHPLDQPAEGMLRAVVRETQQEASTKVTIQPGRSTHEVTITVGKPKLWWPIGHGDQDRYTVDVELTTGREAHAATRRTGIRRVEIDRSPHPVEGEYFIIRINNRPIFCKGGNWVPADMLYSTVTPERHRRLVELAVDANFNTLRVWGGGCYADHALLDACDEAGVLIWHDFLFACAKYPGDDPAFAAEVRREVEFGTRDLAHHPCLVVWCGNNEIEWGDWGWGYDNWGKTHPHYAMFHHDIPMIAGRESPATAYWISSPHSPDFVFPNDPTVGDQHPWSVSILDPGGADFWKYRDHVDRFPNEGGVIGMTSPATLKQFLPENERYLFSPSWFHHDNPFACNAPTPGALGRAYQTVELWTGFEPEHMSWKDYAFISALLQAEGLCEYISNFRRRMFSTSSAIFWMYNDSWPTTHGWTIVDYYLRKKLAYHPVRRAFEPVSVVVAHESNEVVVYGVNETTSAWRGQLRYGLFRLTGGLPADESLDVTLAPNASTELARFGCESWEALGLTGSGAFATLSRDGTIVAQHRLLRERFKDLEMPQPKIDLQVKDGKLTLRSETFAWGVCLDVEGEVPLADNCFDLLPGIPCTMAWSSGLGEPRVVRTGNCIMRQG